MGDVTPGPRAVWIVPELMEAWATRDLEGNRLSWEWGEPDAEGFYTPAITRHEDDNLGHTLTDTLEAANRDRDTFREAAANMQRDRQAAEEALLAARALASFAGRHIAGDTDVQVEDVQAAIDDFRRAARSVLRETIADILGHSSVRVTQDLYRHRVAELQRDAAEKMQEALGG